MDHDFKEIENGELFECSNCGLIKEKNGPHFINKCPGVEE